MKTVFHSRHIWRVVAAGCFLAAAVGLTAPLVAHEALALTEANLRWHAPSKSITVTFLGKQEKETAVLDLRKAAVLDTEISIQSDATTIHLLSGKAIRMSFAVGKDSKTVTSRLKFAGGDKPALLFNDKEDSALHEKWIEVLASKEPNLTIELENATIATVKFDPKSIEEMGEGVRGIAVEPASAPPDSAAEPTAHTDAAGDLLHEISPAQLRASAAAFASAVKHKCNKCLGKGKVVVKVQYATRQEGQTIKKLFRDETRTCEVCKGAGYLRASDESLYRSAAVFVRNLAEVKRDDPGTQDALSSAYKMITDVMIGDYKTWMLLTDTGKSILVLPSAVEGTSVFSKVVVKRILPKVAGKRQFIVEIDGIDKQVQVSDPVIADEIESGTALMGGLITAGKKGDAITVLERGFLIAPPINHVYWWWYGPRPRR